MAAKLSLHCEQWFRQPVAKYADVDRTLEPEQRDKQSQAVFGDFNRSPLTDVSPEMIFIAERI